MKLLNACVHNDVKRFIYTSAYETTQEKNAIIFTENTWGGHSGDPYITGKIECEKAVLKYHDEYKDLIEIVSLIPTMVIGRYLSSNFRGNCRFLKRWLSGIEDFMPN
jgi:nucleoside-diphosphate-sugar epimerase